MVKKKIDQRIRTLIENGVQSRHRTMFVIVGDHAKDQVANLHYILSKAQVAKRPAVLWCYKKELGFSSHRKKRMKQIQKKKHLGLVDAAKVEEDPFDLFLSSTQIRYTYYHETDKILGNTFGMCVLQDFEALTPNLLARTIETVQGGGLVLLLLHTLSSLKQLYTMAMDVHSRYRTENRHEPVARFNERFLLSLAGCNGCLVLDDRLNVLPISSLSSHIEPVAKETIEGFRTDEEIELERMRKDLAMDEKQRQLSALTNLAKTLDQAKVLSSLVGILKEQRNMMRITVSLTAARGRGKSAALGLSLAAAIANGFGSIFVTAPSPENLKTLFEFLLKGLDTLGYTEHLDYNIVQSTHADFNRAIVRINISKADHRQTVLYIHPQDAQLLSQAELIVIDEAAAIPLPMVQALCSGPHLVFMASTINGYEGTGRSLSLKLIQQLRSQTSTQAESLQPGCRILRELVLNEPIRYALNDPVEKWLNQLLCLDVASLPLKLMPSLSSGGGAFPKLDACELYAVNRDTLFSYHKASETFLQRIMALYVASHYKNTPNDLQLISDAPAHRLFVLLPPIDYEQGAQMLPEVLCVIQVCFEGEISKQVIMQSLMRGKRASGDLIPWTLSQQFQDEEFGALSGARIVRIAVHPELQGMGYGSRAMQLLEAYFRGKLYLDDGDRENNKDIYEDEGGEERITKNTNQNEGNKGNDDLHSEIIKPKSNLKPLLVKLSDRKPILLQWLGVSFGLTAPLFKFWRKLDFLPVYLRQTANDITGEHTAIVLKRLEGINSASIDCSDRWLNAFNEDFRRRFLSLLGYQFRTLPISLALDLLSSRRKEREEEGALSVSMTLVEAAKQLSSYDLKRLESYANNMVDYHVIMDLAPTMAHHYFLRVFQGENLSLSPVQSAILLALGLQYRTIEELEKELKLPVSQLLAMFIKTARKFARQYREAHLQRIDDSVHLTNRPNPHNAALVDETPNVMVAKRPLNDPSAWELTVQDLDRELDEGARKIKQQLREKQRELINSLDLEKYTIEGDTTEWEAEIKRKHKNISDTVLSIPSTRPSSQKSKPIAKDLFDKKDLELVKKAKKSKYAK